MERCCNGYCSIAATVNVTNGHIFTISGNSALKGQCSQNNSVEEDFTITYLSGIYPVTLFFKQ